METLIAEDVMLLLLDDEKGTLAASGSARPLFGGALLLDLALGGHVEVAEKSGRWTSAKVLPTDDPAPEDALLTTALAQVAEKPRSAQDLVQRLGKGAREELLARLVDRGVLQRDHGRILGLFPRTTWPAADVSHEQAVRQRLEDVLVTGLVPDDRSAAIIALLSSVDQAHKVVDPGPLSSGEVRKRAKRVAEGDWAATAVRNAVQATQAAVTTAVMAATAAAAAGGGS